MKQKTLDKINEKINLLDTASANFANKLIGTNEMKKVSAPLGIYEQRNSLFMMRIRIPGGELSLEKLKEIIQILKSNQIEKLHITTRQDLQLHDVLPGKLAKIAREFLNISMPFYGGGGDTLRNITACPHGLFYNNSVFDTVPYAALLNSYLMDYDRAFDLPRKFKINISCCPDDFSMAKFTDIGFIAKIANGRRGFEVYSGGGMGRESYAGIKISDFISDDELLLYSVAAINLFYKCGNRENRLKARLRFVLIEKGEDFFRNEFEKQLNDARNLSLKFQLDEIYKTITSGKEKYFARLFIPNGNLSLKILEKIVKNAELYAAESLRFSQNQDVFVIFSDSQKKEEFCNIFPEFSSHKISGLIKSCIGASTCKIGLLDTQKDSNAISNRIYEYLQEIKLDESKL
ncbi:MAG TPA: nitrite/sulfite reductase, partial [Victivallales bacterium]|nr:nitrite/sulfite reductase [Victivallales bacterium]